MIQFTEVQSSNIRAIAHEANTLFVEFRSGHVYRYSNVSNEHYQEMLSAKSKGRHLAQAIKKFAAEHPVTKLTPEEMQELASRRLAAGSQEEVSHA